MSRPFLLRLLETFFRRWVLYLVPVVVLLGLGVMTVTSTKDVYVSAGVMYVDDETLLATLTEVQARGGSAQWWKTAAEVTSEQMNSAFQTEAFTLTVAERAGLKPALEDGTATIDSVRRSVSALPNGSNLVVVRASGAVPEASSRLATAAVESFIEFVVEANLSDSSSAEEFLVELSGRYAQEAAAASDALNTYLRSHPEPFTGSRPALEQAEIDRLSSADDTANERYTNALGKLEDARLATAQTRADVSQRLKLVDEPQTPLAPEGSLRDTAKTMAMFGSLGFLLSAAAVLAATLIDRSIRTAADVTERLHSAVLAELPEAPRSPPFEFAPDDGPEYRRAPPLHLAPVDGQATLPAARGS